MNAPNPPDIHFVLVATTHSGNIGAAARAMKTMGYTSLRLVQPCHYLTTDSLARASGADDIVKAATVYPSLSEALADCTSVYGTSARPRSLEWDVMPARECATRIHLEPTQATPVTAIVFGRERSGLTNDELSLCNHRLWIPCNPAFSSLNLGSAVQVVAYELRMAQLAMTPSTTIATDEPVANTEAMEHFFTHLEQAMVDIDFLDRDNPRLLMRRLRRYFGRNRPQGSELNILRGILTATQKAIR